MAELVMILGSGRLAYRLIKLLRHERVEILHLDSKEFKEMEETDVQESSMEYARGLLLQKGIGKAMAVCVVDSHDAVNIHLLMAVLAARENVPVHVTFFNQNLVSAVVRNHPNVKVYNPASIVSRLFVESLPEISQSPESLELKTGNNNSEGLIWNLILGFVALMLIGTIFFKTTEPVSWHRALYLITTIVSGNFSGSDVSNYNLSVDLARTILMALSFFYSVAALALILDQIVKNRMEISILGRRRYRNKNHVIVCGLGRVGYAIILELLGRKEDVIVIEMDPDNKYLSALRSHKVPVLIGDASLPHYLVKVGITRAKALICAVNSDMTNLVIGLNARSENNNIRLLLRIFDQSTAEEIKKRLNIHYVFSKSAATAKVISWHIMSSYNPSV